MICILSVSYSFLYNAKTKVDNVQISDMSVVVDGEIEPPLKLSGAKSYEKTVKIANKSNSKAFVRASIFLELVTDDGVTYPAEKYIKLKTNSIDWMYGNDGYFYYMDVLKPQDKTTALFDSIELHHDLSNKMYKGAQVRISIRSESCSTIKLKNGQYSHINAWWFGIVPKNPPLLLIHETLKSKGGIL